MPDRLAYDAIDIAARYGPWKYPASERLARHLEAVENGHPWHTERSPWGPPVCPPTMLGNATLRFIDTVAPVPPGTVHVKQEIVTSAALRRDRQPIGYGRFSQKYERRGRRWFTFEVRWREETGLLIAHTSTTMCFPETVETKDDGEKSATRSRQKQPERKPALPPITRTVTQERIDAYSEDSENARLGTSIHVNPEVAKAAGFPNAVAQSMMAGDYISEMLTGAFGKEWFENATLSLAFVKPIFAGDTVTVNAGLGEAKEEGAVVRKSFNVWAENQAGETVAAGTASSLVMPELQ
jgi:acyl dehydratase